MKREGDGEEEVEGRRCKRGTVREKRNEWILTKKMNSDLSSM